MRLINITSVTKNRIAEMITQLIPAVGYVRITRHGLVVMKRHKWSFKKEILNITDICISLLPNKIAELISEHNTRVEYTLEFNKYISNLIYMKYFVNSFDIVDYVWKKYNEIFIIPPDTYLNSATILERTDNISQLLPEIHSLSSRSRLFNVARDIYKSKFSTVESEKNTLLKNINRIVYNLPRKLNLRWSSETIIRHIFYARCDYGINPNRV